MKDGCRLKDGKCPFGRSHDALTGPDAKIVDTGVQHVKKMLPSRMAALLVDKVEAT